MTAKVLDGRYKLIKSLSSGGFGHTYVARDMRRPGSPTCVVKHLQPASNNPEFVREARRLFNSEAESLEKLGIHDQIPQLLAYFEEEQQFYLVQEYIEGRSLQDEINQRQGSQKMSEVEVTTMLRDVLGILDFVHSEGVIHRDLKPENIIRRAKDGRLVLIDFGAVKAMAEINNTDAANSDSGFTVGIGTPGYMPSEQSMGKPNYTSDLYGLGMIAIYALTGLEPTEIPTDPLTGELIWRDRAKVTNLQGSLCEQIKISNGLAMVLTRMVRYQSAQRYQSAKEVLQALSAFVISSEPQIKKVQIGTANPSARVIRTQRKSAETMSGLLIGGVFLLAGATFWYVSSLNKPTTPIVVTPPPVVNPVETTTPNSPPEPIASPTVPTSFSQSLELKLGQTAVKVGTLQPNQTLTYIFAANEKQKLDVSLNGEGVSFDILAPNNVPVAEGISTWNGTLAFSGSYQIQVRLKPGTPEADYILSVLLNEDIPRVIEIR